MNYAHIRKDGTKQLLNDHLLQVAEKASQNAKKINLEKFGEISGLLHDYGKTNPEFQKYLMSATGQIKPEHSDYIDFEKMKGKIDHSTAGSQLFNDLVNIPPQIREIISLIIVSHHGGLLDYVTPDGQQPLRKRLKKEINLNELKEITDKALLAKIEKFSTGELLIHEFKEHIELLKKIGINTDIMFMVGMTIKFLFSSLVDADRTDTIEFENPERKAVKNLNWDDVIEAIEIKTNSFKIRNIVDEYRKKISDECFKNAERDRGIYKLTVPTGGGKTLSSLRFAATHAKKHNLDRIIYVIPYTSIIDQNAETVREILKIKGLEKILLEHHSNLSDEENTETNQIYSENWDTEIIYTTMVQFLETIFSGGTSSSRRLHNLANSVIIFDEIQTISIKNIYMFNNAIKYLHNVCGSTILLCTATQPVLNDKSLHPYNLCMTTPSEISIDYKKMESIFDRVKPIDMTLDNVWKIEDTGKLAIEKHEMNQSVLVIVNTKDAAKEIANIFENSGFDYYHLSTNMCPEHRLEVLTKLREQLKDHQTGSGCPVLCISTQLVEAGVDLDFNTVIRHLAGLDSIVQAAGRCNRNGLMLTKGELYVVNPIDEKISRLYDISEGKRVTEKVLRHLRTCNESYNLLSNEAIELYFQEYYYSRNSEMHYPIKLEEFEVEESLLNLLSRNNKSCSALIRRCPSTKIAFPHAFKTAGKNFKAIDSITKGIVVPFGDGEEIITRLCSSGNEFEIADLLKKAQRYSVNAYEYQIRELYRENAIHETQIKSGVFYLEKNYYSTKFGLDMSGCTNEILLY